MYRSTYRGAVYVYKYVRVREKRTVIRNVHRESGDAAAAATAAASLLSR